MSQSTWHIKLLYDGECPFCLREVNFLKQRDAGKGLIKFVDITDDNYQPQNHGGIDFETAMARIHGVLPDGRVVKDLEVFRRAYQAVGMGWVYAATKLPIIGAIAHGIYGVWAAWRLPLTGRPNLQTIVEQKRCQDQCQVND